MGEILNRYILRETAQTWFAVTGVLMLILLTDQFASVLDDAAGADIPRDAIFAVMGLSSIQYLTVIIPIGIFLAIMLALARMYRDSEMAALQACGIGNMALYRPVILLALGLAVLVSWLSMEAGPSAVRAVQEITDEAEKESDLAVLKPGHFNSFGRKQTVLYAESITDDGVLEKVFVQRRRDDKVIVIVAEQASQNSDEQTGQKEILFKDGRRYEGVPGQQEFTVMRFREHGIPFEARESLGEGLKEEAMTLMELLDTPGPGPVAELQWRFSVPIMLLILTLIAVPLSKAPPRQGRYNNLAFGILVYLIYTNMLGASKAWVEDGLISPAIGLWWVHAFFIAFAIIMLMRQNGVFRRAMNGSRRSNANS